MSSPQRYLNQPTWCKTVDEEAISDPGVSSVIAELFHGAVDLLVTVGHHLLEALRIMFDNFYVY